jgi:hypothetical protein
MEDAIRTRFLNRLPAAGMAIPFVLALAAQIAEPRPGPVAAAPARPALAFHQYLVDLGHVTASENVLAHFDFANRGSKDLEITELAPSCGCLQPHLKKKIYKPDESGFFTLKIQTANQAAGQKEYTVTVKYNDPAPQEALVVMRVVLPDDQVLVRPIALFFYQLGDYQPGDGRSGHESTSLTRLGIEPQNFEVTDRRSRHLNIQRVECNNPDVLFERQDDDIDESGTWHGRFRVSMDKGLPPGRHQEVVRIFTDDPDDRYRVLRVPLYMEGPARRKKVDRHVRQTSGTEAIGRRTHEHR